MSWPDEIFVEGTLASIRKQVKPLDITRTALILVGRALDAGVENESRLYSPDHTHVFREG